MFFILHNIFVITIIITISIIQFCQSDEAIKTVYIYACTRTRWQTKRIKPYSNINFEYYLASMLLLCTQYYNNNNIVNLVFDAGVNESIR